MIVLDGDRGTGFKLVHAALAAVSVALAVLALRRARRLRARPRARLPGGDAADPAPSASDVSG